MRLLYPLALIMLNIAKADVADARKYMRFADIEWYEILDSTQNRLCELARRGERGEGSVIAARAQTAGRGRGRRRWLTAAGKDLAFSFLISCPPLPQPLGALGMTAAIAVAETAQSFGLAPRLKWPNDVLVVDRKISGILVERLANTNSSLAVVGIGMNVNMTAEDAKCLPAATSLSIETGKKYELSAVLEEILARLSPWLRRWQKGDGAAWRARWNELSFFRPEQAIALKSGSRLRSGIFAGYGENGELLLRTARGEIEAVWSGEAEKKHEE